MRNIKLTIQYDGTRYAGWQFQKNAISIQEVIERSIKKITGKAARIVGSGRTDAGVHALCQIANFKTRSKIPLKNLQMALNSTLPKDIVITRVDEAHPAFDSQRDARSKVYRYTIANNDFLDPFMRRFAAKVFYKLDLGLMRKASRILSGRHDFRSFRANDGEDKMCVRNIKRIDIEKCRDIVYIYIEADGFLYKMTRNIVGTLVEIGREKMAWDAVRGILLKKDRRLSGPTMPAKGLCLVKVKY